MIIEVADESSMQSQLGEPSYFSLQTGKSFCNASNVPLPSLGGFLVEKWQRADLEAMIELLVLATERSGVRPEDTARLGAMTKHKRYIKYLCHIGLFYLAFDGKGKNKVYLPLPSAHPITQMAWQAKEEPDPEHARELVSAACYAILYREPLWRAFANIQVALFLGLLYHDYGKANIVKHDLEMYPQLAATSAIFFEYARCCAGRHVRERLGESADQLRSEAERLFHCKEFYAVFKQMAESLDLKFTDWSASWPRWRSYWLMANQIPILLSASQGITDRDRQLLATLLAAEHEDSAVVSIDALGWTQANLNTHLRHCWLLGLTLVEHEGELRSQCIFEWLLTNPEQSTECWALPGSHSPSFSNAWETWTEEFFCSGSRVIDNALQSPLLHDFDRQVINRLCDSSIPRLPFPVALLPSTEPGPCYGQNILSEDFVSKMSTKVSRNHPYLFVLNLLIDFIRDERWYRREEVHIVSKGRDYHLAYNGQTAPLGELITKLLETWDFTVFPVRSYEPLWEEASRRGLLPPRETYWQEHYVGYMTYDLEWRLKISRPLRTTVVEQLVALFYQEEHCV